jgi:hypothetical protein
MIALIIAAVLLAFIAVIIMGAYFTNPFSRGSIVRQPFTARMVDGQLQIIDYNYRLRLHQSLIYKVFVILKNFVYVLTSRYVHSPGSDSPTIEGIISDIHRHRFKVDKLLLTSGDHFSALFVRNLGVFYYPMLDRRIASEDKDWQARQIVYLQTVAYALGAFAKRPIPVTTIASTGAWAATGVNIYAYPSDALYGVFYALAALAGKEAATPAPEVSEPILPAQTTDAAEYLMLEYKPTMTKLYAHYRKTVYDQESGLIRKDIHLSGAKDITRRTCAFFDNVIFWKTTQLAMTLGLIEKDQPFLNGLKKRIITTFWDEKLGYFLEDLSDEGLKNRYYSSDWLIVLITGFLDMNKAKERKYYERSVEYIQKMKIDQPFPIKYQHETRAHRQFIAVRLVMAAYGGDAIWSFWGMEYIKTLMLLYRQTGKKEYLQAADQHIASYERVMLRDHGYPEVYDKDGNLMETFIYRSIRQTGWVIGFEQVRAMRSAITK